MPWSFQSRVKWILTLSCAHALLVANARIDRPMAIRSSLGMAPPVREGSRPRRRTSVAGNAYDSGAGCALPFRARFRRRESGDYQPRCFVDVVAQQFHREIGVAVEDRIEDALVNERTRRIRQAALRGQAPVTVELVTQQRMQMEQAVGLAGGDQRAMKV